MKKILSLLSGNQNAELKTDSLYFDILQSVKDGVHVVDMNGIVIVENRASEKMLDWCEGCLVGENGHEAMHHHHPDKTVHHISDCPIHHTLADGKTRHIADDMFWRQDGRGFPVEYTVSRLLDSNKQPCGAVIVFRDISEKKEKDAEIKRLAMHCSLTDIPNRNLFYDRFEQTLQSSKRNESKFAVMFIDLDNFKAINDIYGHEGGDTVLMSVARGLVNVLRSSDTVARFGGDEFVVIAKLVNDSDVETLAQKILEQVSNPVTLANNTLEVTCSVGISIYPNHGANQKELLDKADTAMYQVKKKGRSYFKVFSSKDE